MLVRLILIFFPFITLAKELPSKEELSAFAHSKAYVNLFYVDKESTAYHDQFFMSGSEGRKNLEFELISSLEIFSRDQQKRCHFPARFTLIQKQWPQLFKGSLVHCQELQAWMKDLPVDEVSLVFSGAYINNPASMFGHVFLNLHHSSQPKLLGYSLSYEANINPDDMAVFYMLKGLFGGYLGFFNLKPYYENVGAYNNAESRELWEYPLKLTETEIVFLKYHLWELIHHSGFKYFFTHKNCASYLARFLMAIKPEMELSMSDAVLSFPHKMLKEGVAQIGASSPRYRSSLKDRILFQYEKLSGEEKKKYFAARKDYSQIQPSLPRNVLELLVDEMKFINYKKETDLKVKEKAIFEKSLSSLASNIEKPSATSTLEAKYFPHESHEAKKIRFSFYEDSLYALSFRLGEHNYEDINKGFNKTSFVEFGKLEIQYKKDEKDLNLKEANFIEILSLNPFSRLFPSPSWTASFNYKESCSLCKSSENKIWSLKGALGLSQNIFSEIVQLSFFSGLQALRYTEGEAHYKARPYSELLLKVYFSDSLHYLGKLQRNWSIDHHLASAHSLSYALKKNAQVGIGLDYFQEEAKDDTQGKIFFDFYL